MDDALYHNFLFWYYPFMVAVGMIGVFTARKRSWIWGILFLAIVAFAGYTEHREMQKIEQIFIQELMDSVIDPGKIEQYDIEDDIWAGEEDISYTKTDVHKI